MLTTSLSLAPALEGPSDLTVLAPRKAGDMFFSVSIDLAEQPVRHADHSIGTF